MARVKLLRVNQVAEILSADKKTVYRWITDGVIPALEIGRSKRVVEEDLIVVIQKLREKHGFDNGFVYPSLFEKK